MSKTNIMLAIVLLITVVFLVYRAEWYAVTALLAAVVFIVLRRVRNNLLK